MPSISFRLCDLRFLGVERDAHWQWIPQSSVETEKDAVEDVDSHDYCDIHTGNVAAYGMFFVPTLFRSIAKLATHLVARTVSDGIPCDPEGVDKDADALVGIELYAQIDGGVGRAAGVENTAAGRFNGVDEERVQVAATLNSVNLAERTTCKRWLVHIPPGVASLSTASDTSGMSVTCGYLADNTGCVDVPELVACEVREIRGVRMPAKFPLSSPSSRIPGCTEQFRRTRPLLEGICQLTVAEPYSCRREFKFKIDPWARQQLDRLQTDGPRVACDLSFFRRASHTNGSLVTFSQHDQH
ncbi:hypothetical protein A5684_20110 [Mycobacterium intracellulare]|nr:hypothetical protein A5684_20110 [Mycobacterium intracellulare]